MPAATSWRSRVASFYSRVAPFERGGFHVARWARNALPKHAWHGTFNTPDGLSIDLDLGTYPDFSMAVGLYEIDTVRLIRKLLKPGGHFVDCGANIGYITLLAARHLGPNGRVDSFEPEPANLARLRANLDRNSFATQVTVHDVAVSDSKGQVSFYRPTDAHLNHGQSSLFAPHPGSTTSNVATVRVDQVLAGTSPDLIKLDVEGAEPMAVDGMRDLLTAHKPPRLIVEHNLESARLAGFAPNEWLRRLMDMRAWRVSYIGAKLYLLDDPLDQLSVTRQGNVLVEAL